jgi:hypothetical protein
VCRPGFILPLVKYHIILRWHADELTGGFTTVCVRWMHNNRCHGNKVSTGLRKARWYGLNMPYPWFKLNNLIRSNQTWHIKQLVKHELSCCLTSILTPPCRLLNDDRWTILASKDAQTNKLYHWITTYRPTVSFAALIVSGAESCGRNRLITVVAIQSSRAKFLAFKIWSSTIIKGIGNDWG